MIIRKKDIDVRQHRLEPRQVVSWPRRDHVQHRPGPRLPCGLEDRRQVLRPHLGENQVAAQVEHAAALDLFKRNVRGTELSVGAERVDEPPVLPGDVDDQRLAGSGALADLDAGDIDAVFAQHVGHDPSENIAAHPANDGRTHLHLGQIHRGVGCTAADGQEQALRHHEFAGGRQVGDRRGDMVRDDNAGTQHIDGIADGQGTVSVK